MSVAVSSPPFSEKSPGSTANFWIFCAFETEYLGQALCGDLIVINTEWDCHGIEIRGEVDLFPVTGVVQAVSGQGIVNFAFSDTEEQWKLLSSTQDDADGVW